MIFGYGSPLSTWQRLVDFYSVTTFEQRLLICGALEKHLHTYLLTYLLTHLLTYLKEESEQNASNLSAVTFSCHNMGQYANWELCGNVCTEYLKGVFLHVCGRQKRQLVICIKFFFALPPSATLLLWLPTNNVIVFKNGTVAFSKSLFVFCQPIISTLVKLKRTQTSTLRRRHSFDRDFVGSGGGARELV